MLNFISRVISTALGYVTGSWQTAIRDVIGFIKGLFQAEHSYWQTVSQHVRNAWMELTRGILISREGISGFMDSQYRWDAKISRSIIPWLAHWIEWLGGKVRQDREKALKQVYSKMQSDYNKNHSYTSSVLKWILIHVLGFLYGILKTAVSWISGAGSTMWHYFSHLDEFALLLFWHIVTSLEKLAWDAGKRLGTFFLSLILHNVVRFATLVESIVDAIL